MGGGGGGGGMRVMWSAHKEVLVFSLCNKPRKG